MAPVGDEESIMKQIKSKKSIGRRLAATTRKVVALSSGELVRISSVAPDQPLPRVIEPAIEGVRLESWVANHRSSIEDTLLETGGILFRGFPMVDVDSFEAIVAALSGELLSYSYRSTPRSEVSGRIYTSTEYPPEQSIPLHNEMSYSASWPLKIWFFCHRAAPEGGATPLADSRKVLARIDPEIRRRFAERGVMYVRNYSDRLDLPWSNVFQTEDRAAVEEFCRTAGIRYEWGEEGRLRTSQVCQGVARHPLTGDAVWFNQAHLFHVSSLGEEIGSSLSAMAEGELPRNACYGDGSAIEADVLDHVRGAYEAETVAFPWRSGDVLLLDNMLTAHGRAPFRGPRKVLVGMAEPVDGTAMKG